MIGALQHGMRRRRRFQGGGGVYDDSRHVAPYGLPETASDAGSTYEPGGSEPPPADYTTPSAAPGPLDGMTPPVSPLVAAGGAPPAGPGALATPVPPIPPEEQPKANVINNATQNISDSVKRYNEVQRILQSNFPQMAMAGALLSPTRTGGFAESLGNAMTTGAQMTEAQKRLEAEALMRQQQMQMMQDYRQGVLDVRNRGVDVREEMAGVAEERAKTADFSAQQRADYNAKFLELKAQGMDDLSAYRNARIEVMNRGIDVKQAIADRAAQLRQTGMDDRRANAQATLEIQRQRLGLQAWQAGTTAAQRDETIAQRGQTIQQRQQQITNSQEWNAARQRLAEQRYAQTDINNIMNRATQLAAADTTGRTLQEKMDDALEQVTKGRAGLSQPAAPGQAPQQQATAPTGGGGVTFDSIPEGATFTQGGIRYRKQNGQPVRVQ